MAIQFSEVLGWAKAFAFTELVEVPIYRRFGPTGIGTAFAASAITHPFVWFVFPWLGAELELSWPVTVVASEAFAWAVEAVFVHLVARIVWRRAAVVSLAANAASLGLGLGVRALFGVV